MAIAYKDYLIEYDQHYSLSERSEVWVLTHAIPRDVWDTDSWNSSPVRGASSSGAGYPAGLEVGGVLLRKRIDFKSRPGWVLVYLTYGYAYTHLTVNKGYVTTRTIMVEKQLTHAYTSGTKTQIVGPKFVADEKTVTQEYDITPGDDYDRRIEEPFQLIRIHALLNAAGLNTYVGTLLPFSGALNTAKWTLLNKEIEIAQMKYNGAATDFYRALSATEALYTADFDFVVHPHTWQATVKRTLYDIVTHAVPHVASDGTVIGEKIVKGRKVATGGNEATAYDARLTHDFKETLGPLLTA